jgi:hypothetical protein
MKNINKYTIALLIIAVGLIIAQEFNVDGKLTVTDEIDLSGNRITNVGDPIEETDGVNALYVESRVSNHSNIIELSCGWSEQCTNCNPEIGSCTPPSCPEGWTELAQSNVIAGVHVLNVSNREVFSVGNTTRICIEGE